MKPWIGKGYANANKKVLLIGESHYLDKDDYRPEFRTPEWYSLSEKILDPSVIEYLSTAKIIECSISQGFKHKPHGIYKEIAWLLKDVGFSCPEGNDEIKYGQTLHHISYFNFYQRPAEFQGESIIPGSKDREIASCVLKWFIEKYSPDIILSVSRKAGDEIALLINDIPFRSVPHPGCVWWKRKSAKYDGKKGYAFAREFLLKHL